MSLTTKTSSNTIHLVIKGLAGVLVDSSSACDDKVRVYVRVFCGGVFQAVSSCSHRLRPTGNVVYSLQRYVASWSQRHAKSIRIESSMGQVLQLQIWLQFPDSETCMIGKGEWACTNKNEDISDVEIICCLSDDMKDSFPYRIDPRGDAVLRLATISSESKHEWLSHVQRDPPGLEGTWPLELSIEQILESPVKTFSEKSVALATKEDETPSPKKKVSFSPTKLETRFIIPANKKSMPFFPALFGGAKNRKENLSQNTRGKDSVATKPRIRARATTISVAPVIPQQKFSPKAVKEIDEMSSVTSHPDETSFVWNGPPLHRNTVIESTDRPHTPIQPWIHRPEVVSPDPPERSVHLSIKSSDVEALSNSSTREEETEFVDLLLDASEASEAPETDDVRSTSPFELKRESLSEFQSQPETLESDFPVSVLTISGMGSYSEIVHNESPHELIQSHLSDHSDHDELTFRGNSWPNTTPSSETLSTNSKESSEIIIVSYGKGSHGLSETFEREDVRTACSRDEVTDEAGHTALKTSSIATLIPHSLKLDLAQSNCQTNSTVLQESCLQMHKNEDNDIGCFSPQRHPTPEQLGLMWDGNFLGTSPEVYDDSEGTVESLTRAGNELNFLFSFDHKDSSEESNHHSWISARDDESFFTAGCISGR